MTIAPAIRFQVRCWHCNQRFWLPPGVRTLPPHLLQAHTPASAPCPGVLGQPLV
jgi:hypothetical protein